MTTDKDDVIANLERVKTRIKEVTEILKYVDSRTQWRYYKNLKSELQSLRNEKKLLDDLLARL